MGNAYTIAGKLEQARQVDNLRDDVEPMLQTALRLWQRASRGLCASRTEQAEAITGCLMKLQAAAQTIIKIEEAGVIPVEGAAGNGKLKPMGTVGGADNKTMKDKG